MVEINLMEKYPQTKRNPNERLERKTREDETTAKKFGKDFFDGNRKYGYGGYNYNPKFWSGVVRDMIDYYGLKSGQKILDVGCAKGFMLFDFMEALPGISIRGIDVSSYAIKNSKPEVKPFLSVGNAKNLENFKDKEFDLVISINTIHNLPLEGCKQSLREIQRVGRDAFITVDAWRNEDEKERMNNWNLTAETFMHVNEWKKLFDEVGYFGDYYWFIP